ncbi:hypothetical protein GUITHDRAFT_99188 [Guillardia theta CCMP2712]|uniref:Uncharacterized protein n=1 Tax=Guillardia theta (strain CCMP2712) TaxID=905079 RepID=L1K4M2_GUITC|nr:hypothetical protein GUITHDRAFT_99188 [Guillardia theta CCMP2712]EKX55410.1 hypothetical protein GUITHDRAFT_99188 [Guillardia theta CCMP2712]|eukprot:XP_005842390.1 hypothetical protein GUITHDRAFT_99188 [Guillardia theta CCMP2712]
MEEQSNIAPQRRTLVIRVLDDFRCDEQHPDASKKKMKKRIGTFLLNVLSESNPRCQRASMLSGNECLQCILEKRSQINAGVLKTVR